MWNRRDLACMGVWTAGTMATTLALFWNGSAVADDPIPNRVVIATPTLAAKDYQFSVRLPDQAKDAPNDGLVRRLPAGKLPKLQLLASSTGVTSAPIHWKAEVQVSEQRDLMSRTPSMPKSAWSQEGELSLKPGEKTTIPLATSGISLKAGSTASVVITVGDQRTVGLTLATDRPAVASAAPSSKVRKGG